MTYTATDDNGNTANCEVIINVVDNISPSIECIESVTVAYGESLEPENTGSPTVSDNCSIATTTYSDSSSQGADGCSLVNYSINRFWTTTDTSGNSTICLQVINVVDASGPIVITQDISVELDEEGNVTITPEEIDNGSNDACGITTLELDITSFDTSNIGENTVQLTVTDSNGNFSIGYAIVTVEPYALGIEEYRDLNILVYPNPTMKSFQISGLKEKTNLVIYDTTGKEVFRKRDYLDEKINIERFSSGVYMIRLTHDTLSTTKKIIKN